MALLFWIALSILFYTFIGYGILLFCLVKIKRIFHRKDGFKDRENGKLPTCSILIAAYNEEKCIEQKIINTLKLNYPPERLNIYIVADGSTDKTTDIIRKYPQVKLLYDQVRKGKIHAINRAIQFINTEIIVFTDANTFLNQDALPKICKHYADSGIGGVAGEKRIFITREADAATAGENLYWKYESLLKKWDSELNTTIGAAGELFSIRRTLYEPIPDNAILDDFLISMRIAQKGFKIVYEPEAYAIEAASSSVKEEYKRKIRIAAGGIQSIIALQTLLYPFKFSLLRFQYISHRVLRWTITPFLLPITLIVNSCLVVGTSAPLYIALFIAQILFYSLALIGLFLEKKEIRFKLAFVPYYFCMMNYCIIAGIIKFLRKDQSSVWEKVERKEDFERPILTMSQE